MNTGDLLDGRFRLRDRLGAGGMSVVWRANDEVLGRDVAVKVLSRDLARDPVLLARIRDEARAVARLRHPNIVDVYDYYGESPGSLPYVVMEVVEGRSLSELLSGGPLPWRLAVLVGAQVAAALAAAHDRSVVHRDVKPGNVMVGGARVKLVDFGISALSGDDDRAAGELLGTPAYLAPERLEHGVVRPATDVYALGLLLHRMLAGRLPWQASTATEMFVAHRYQEPSALPRIAGLPAEVAELCRRCLTKDPEGRPSAAEAATVLAGAAGLSVEILALPGGSDDATEPVKPARRVPTSRASATQALTGVIGSGRLAGVRRRLAGVRRHRRLVVAAGTALVLTSGALVAAAFPGDPDTPSVQAGSPALAGVPAAASPPTTAAPAPECTVGYVVAAAGGRFTTKVSVANSGAVAIPAAPLTFTLPGKQRLRSGNPGTWRQSGRTVTARIADLPPGHSHAATLRGTYQGVTGLPDRFQLNGVSCRVTLSVAAAAPAAPAAPAPRVKTAAKKPPKPEKPAKLVKKHKP